MARRSKEEAQKIMKSIAILLRNTTWKCGSMERLVVAYLQEKFRRRGKAQIPINEMLQDFKLRGKRKSEFLDAIKRLEKRQIIKVESF